MSGSYLSRLFSSFIISLSLPLAPISAYSNNAVDSPFALVAN